MPAVAGLCGLLTVAKMGLVPERGTTEMWKVVANRCLALFAIGMTALLGVLRRRAEVERRRAEERLREHQADLAHMGRLSALGQVTATLAHELNQPLAAVCLQADMAARLAASNGQVQTELTAALAEIAEQSARAAEILRGVRRMARRTSLCRDAIDLNDAARGVVRLMEWQARRAGVAVHLRLAADRLETAFGDRTQIEQVLFNLIQNAIEATARLIDGPREVTVETVAEAESVTVIVRDTGPGLADPGRVFERFYTTKPNGTGLGLAISRSIVEAHGGRLRAEPAVGGRDRVLVHAAGDPQGELVTAEPTVFVVDDDEAVRRALTTAIALLGHPVLVFASAQEFLAAYQPTQHGCLVLDIKMPGMTGLELQRKLADAGATIPIVMISGHADVRMAVEAMTLGAVTLLEKPFRLEELLEHIRQALKKDQDNRAARHLHDETAVRLAQLSVKEREVLDMLAAGKTNREMAEQLGLSVRAVEDRRARLMRKVEAESLADLVRLFERQTS